MAGAPDGPLPFAGAARSGHLEAMAARGVDVLVVGGGITGAGVAWDATLRGLRVGLVDMQDFAAGTSSRSTRLVHGGLRYLETLEFAMVREVARERAVLRRLAPHLVRPLPMLLPVLPGARRGRTAIAFGTWLYDRLADASGEDRRRMLGAARARLAEPLLRPDVAGAALYGEYAVDDARLTLEVVRAAVARGARAANYARVEGAVRDRAGGLRAVQVRDMLSGEGYEIPVRVVVNAAGPWAAGAAALLAGDDPGLRLRLSKGVHVVVPASRLPLRQAVYFEEPDGRLVFAVPHGATAYVGTTDTPYEGDPATVAADAEDVAYLLAAARSAFPAAGLGPADLVAAWAGVRPLLAQPGRSTGRTSRRDEILVGRSGVISVAGGKLTGFRRMAERIVDRAQAALGGAGGPCATATTPIATGTDAPGAETGGPDGAIDGYAGRVARAIDGEMAVRAVDVLARRTGLLPFAPDLARERAPLVLARLAAAHGWSADRRADEIRSVGRALAEATDAVTALRR